MNRLAIHKCNILCHKNKRLNYTVAKKYTTEGVYKSQNNGGNYV